MLCFELTGYRTMGRRDRTMVVLHASVADISTAQVFRLHKCYARYACLGVTDVSAVHMYRRHRCLGRAHILAVHFHCICSCSCNCDCAPSAVQ